ncbi:MAG: glycosyltransferase [Ktedonobacterales bacterium]
MSATNARRSGDDPFAILGVSQDCTPAELKHAYRVLARRYHPDVNPSPEAVEQMRRINLAFSRAQLQIEAAGREWQPAQPQAAPAVPRRASASAPAAAAPAAAAPDGRASARGPAASPVTVRARGEPLRVARGRATSALGWAAGAARRVAQAWHVSHWRRRLAAAAVGVAAIGMTILVVVALPRLHPDSPTTVTTIAPSVSGMLRLGATTAVNWQDTGTVTLTERLIARLPAGLHLNEGPQWSPDGTLVALSVTPAGAASGTASGTSSGTRGSSILLLHDGRQIGTISGTSGRWSPVDDTLAVLTNPGTDGVPQLEIVTLTTLGSPVVLDPHAGTHVAWSPDGTRLAYSANEQQALLVTRAVAGSSAVVMTAARGEHLIPIGWLRAMIVCLVHAGNAASLIEVDAATHHVTPVAGLGALAGDPLVVNDAIVYAPKTTHPAPVTLDRLQPAAQSSVTLTGISAVRFLSGWSPDDAWLAASPAPSGTQSSELCVAHASAAATNLTASSWSLHCLRLPGTLFGATWEPRSSTLSYVRSAAPNGPLELRALGVRLSDGALGVRPRGTPSPASNPGWLLAALIAGLGRRGPRRHTTTAASVNQPAGSAAAPRAAPHAGAHMLRIAVISEILRWPPDEGLKRIALALVQHLARYANVMAISTRAPRPGADPYPVVTVAANRSFIQPRLWLRLRQFSPDVVCYIPGSGLTAFSLVRALALRLGLNLLGKRAVLALVSVQPKRFGRLHASIFRLLEPLLVIVQSGRRGLEFRALGCRVHAFTGAVDVEVFKPAATDARARLRREWGIPPESFVALHVGHLRPSRNLDALAALRLRCPDVTLLLAASTSTRRDLALEQSLLSAGIRVIKSYVPQIECLYQLADCYVFPVQASHGSAELPLSVLEALACGLPVATTRFGALDESLPQGPAVRYFESTDELADSVRQFMQAPPTATVARQLALMYGWDHATQALVGDLESLMASAEPVRRTRHWRAREQAHLAGDRAARAETPLDA